MALAGWDADLPAESAMVLALCETIGLARTHQNQSEVRSERGVMCIDSVERQFARGWQFHQLGPRGLQLAAQRFMLCQGFGVVGRMMNSQIAPESNAFWLIPSGGARR